MKEEQENIDEIMKEKELHFQFSRILISVKESMLNIIRIDGVDYDGTIESIKKDMVFGLHTVWILIFSIFIAPTGLIANSIPIIIGAMLISAVMRPIIAVGLSIGTNDLHLFKCASKNFLIAFLISPITYKYNSNFYLSIGKPRQTDILKRVNINLSKNG